MILCSYGCGKEAIVQFNTGNWCCNRIAINCPNVARRGPHKELSKRKMRDSHTGLKQSIKTCEKRSSSMKGKTSWNKGLTKDTNEIIRNSLEKKKVKYLNETKEERRIRSESHKGQVAWNKDKKTGFTSEKQKESCRKLMMGPEGNRIRKQIKNPSKDELKLREIVKELFPTSEHTYLVLESKGYEVDNALIEYKIAIEFDGWYHFCDQEHIDYHKKRQREIEQEGWKFIRYDIFHSFPSKEKVLEDIQNILK